MRWIRNAYAVMNHSVLIPLRAVSRFPPQLLSSSCTIGLTLAPFLSFVRSTRIMLPPLVSWINRCLLALPTVAAAAVKIVEIMQMLLMSRSSIGFFERPSRNRRESLLLRYYHCLLTYAAYRLMLPETAVSSIWHHHTTDDDDAASTPAAASRRTIRNRVDQSTLRRPVGIWARGTLQQQAHCLYCTCLYAHGQTDRCRRTHTRSLAHTPDTCISSVRTEKG